MVSSKHHRAFGRVEEMMPHLFYHELNESSHYHELNESSKHHRAFGRVEEMMPHLFYHELNESSHYHKLNESFWILQGQLLGRIEKREEATYPLTNSTSHLIITNSTSRLNITGPVARSCRREDVTHARDQLRVEVGGHRRQTRAHGFGAGAITQFVKIIGLFRKKWLLGILLECRIQPNSPFLRDI